MTVVLITTWLLILIFIILYLPNYNVLCNSIEKRALNNVMLFIL